MRHKLILLLFALCGFSSASVAQKNAAKVYVAKVTSLTTPVSVTLTKRDQDEITYQARSTISNLNQLLSSIEGIDSSDAVRNTIIQNSYLPNSNQLFYNDAVVVEDDIDPKHTSFDSTADLPIDRYLRDFDLFYPKSDTGSTVSFTRLVPSTVLLSKTGNYYYIKLFFLSTFNGKRTDSDRRYRPSDRVAELRAEKVNKKWRTYIIRLGFLQLGEGLTELTRPIISTAESVRLPAIKGDETTFRRTDGLSDSLLVKWDQLYLNVFQSSTSSIPVGPYQRSGTAIADQTSVRIALTDNDRQLTFTRINGETALFSRVGPPAPGPTKPKPIVAWLQIAVGAAAITASVIGYLSIRSSYDAYTTRLSGMNAEYAVWQTLSQQQGVSPAAPMSFSTYAQPGIYGVYGGTAIGSGLIINGVRQLLKINRIKRRAGSANR